MFFRRAFTKNQNDYNKDTFEEMSPPEQMESPPSPQKPWHMKTQQNNSKNTKNNQINARRGSFGEREKQQMKSSAISCGGGLR